MDGHGADITVDFAVVHRIGEGCVVVAILICRRCVFQETSFNISAANARHIRNHNIVQRQLTKQWSLRDQNTRHRVIVLVDIVKVIQGKHISRVFRRRYIRNIGDVIVVNAIVIIINNLRLGIEARNRDCRRIINHISRIISDITISNLIGNGNLNLIVSSKIRKHLRVNRQRRAT